ncbi:MAG TPA: tRNA preQ1(34) S-adenosylmethionine ribosyltransferase-isomerase QueA [Steroidobacteraceae bacterium]|nr:tRNA preQ1(34) S-adenosylmethionine ribosyltransferase-isomerase QueA [Steroidobacteraceae bacterium]
MQSRDFHFDLPRELIAQRPLTSRSASRLLVIDGRSGACRDLEFRDLPQLLRAADLLVFNDTRVVPARLRARKESGGAIELLLERVLTPRTALVHARSSKPLRPGVRVILPPGHEARCLERREDLFVLEFSMDVLALFEAQGETPLPPYIERAPEPEDRERYQTVYARAPGAVAAPTAGLHFDETIFAALAVRGVERAFVTLHVGAGTFQPLRTEQVEAHVMHEEYVEVPASTCRAIEAARAAGGRVIAVGTTVVRSLESAAVGGAIAPFTGFTRMFIRPGYRFRAIDALITNFHLPESTLLMLCAALVGRERLLNAYAHAVRRGYRFFSYGDACFLEPAAGALERG